MLIKSLRAKHFQLSIRQQLINMMPEFEILGINMMIKRSGGCLRSNQWSIDRVTQVKIGYGYVRIPIHFGHQRR